MTKERLMASQSVTSWQGDATNGYDTPTGVIAPSSGMAVKKFGRTSGLTKGKVEALINTPFPVPYKCRFFSATVWFHEVWTVKADQGNHFALPGDSGSLVVTDDASRSVGVVFAASPNGEYGFIVPMDRVVTLLGGLRLVGHHGV